VAAAAPGSSEGFGILAAIIIMLARLRFGGGHGAPHHHRPLRIAIAFAVLDLLTHVMTVPVFAPRSWP